MESTGKASAEATGPDDAAIAFLRAEVAAPPFHRWLRPEVVAADADGVILRLPYRPEFSRAPDRDEVHGGIIATLIDMAGYSALSVALRRPTPTINLRIDYLRMAGATSLTATARPRRLGRSIGLVDIEVADAEARLIALGRGSFATMARG